MFESASNNVSLNLSREGIILPDWGKKLFGKC